MKNTRKMLAALLAAALCLALTACGGNTTTTEAAKTTTKAAETTAAATTQEATTQEQEACDIAGEYYLDGTPLGMPMQWYLKLTEDWTFQISTARDYAADKGNGQVAESNGTYVLVYSDSTNDAPKNATFTVKDGNLYFTTSVPIGSANMPGSEEAPFVAYCYANEDLLGEYVAAYESNGMMGTVNYDLCLTLETGRRFTYTSTFAMGGSEYTYTETGSFAIDGKVLALTAAKKVTAANIESGELTDIENPSTLSGTIEAGKIDIALLTSPMKSDTVALNFVSATTAEVAGKYYGYKTSEMFTIESVLKLGKNGSYCYTSDFASAMMGNVSYYEEGSFVQTETGVALTPAQSRTDDAELAPIASAETYELTQSGLIFSGKLPTGGMASALTLCKSNINGCFTATNAENAAEGDKIYQLTLDMKGDTSYTLKVASGFDVLFETAGTFEASETMITFSYEEGACKFIAMLSDNSFNAKNVPIDEEGGEDSFEFTKAAASVAAGSYSSSYTSESAMGTTVYTLSLVLNEDGTYDYTAEFTMGGTTYQSKEAGLYLENGNELQFKALKATTTATIESGEMSDIAEDQQEVLTGTLTEGQISLTRKVSCMARSAVDLVFAPAEEAMPSGMGN